MEAVQFREGVWIREVFTLPVMEFRSSIPSQVTILTNLPGSMCYAPGCYYVQVVMVFLYHCNQPKYSY